MIADYHLHTRFSSDCEVNPELHIKRAIELGMNEFGNTLFAPVQLAYIGLGTLLSGWGNAVRDSKNKRRTSVQQERLSQDMYNKFIASVIEYARSKGKA